MSQTAGKADEKMDPMELMQIAIGLVSGGAAGGIAVTVPVLQLKGLRAKLRESDEAHRLEIAELRREHHKDAITTTQRIDALLSLVATRNK